MSSIFQTIGIIGNLNCSRKLIIHQDLYNFLVKHGYEVILEQKIAQALLLENISTGNISEIGKQADLAIVIGGDGSMLRASRTLAKYDIKVIGINFGNLGFLTDLDPDTNLEKLFDILKGKFFNEKRFLLKIEVIRDNICNHENHAINEIVIHSGKIANMIQFEVCIDNKFAFSQRSDGLIVSTPTGSTAYSLSAGGPILVPPLNAIVLVPMFPHIFSSRPIIIDNKSVINLKFSKLPQNLKVSCDGQSFFSIQEKEEIFIRKSKYFLHLVHPVEYNYFHTLNNKLGWSKTIRSIG